jgi:hypothetical protein
MAFYIFLNTSGGRLRKTMHTVGGGGMRRGTSSTPSKAFENWIIKMQKTRKGWAPSHIL